MPRISPKENSSYPWYLRLMFMWQKHKYGQEIIPAKIWGNEPILLRRFISLFRAFERKSSPLPADLRALITVLVSQINWCEFCIDFNSARVLKLGDYQNKLEDLKNFQESSVFSDSEKIALEYAKVVTDSNTQVDNELFSRLQKHFSDQQIVELTGLIAFQNMSSKFNAALDIEAQGMCQIT